MSSMIRPPAYVSPRTQYYGPRFGSGGQLNEMAARWMGPGVLSGFDPSYRPQTAGPLPQAPEKPPMFSGGSLEGFGSPGGLQPGEGNAMMQRAGGLYGPPKQRRVSPPTPTAPYGRM